jgi:protein-tyrosine phosphatase
MAEGLFRRDLAAAGVDAVVESAGLVTQGQEASRHGVDAMARRGVDIDAHRSRRLSGYLVDEADLVVGMERGHVREVAVLDAAAFRRTFTLPELVRRGRAIGPRPRDEPLDHWLERASAGRRPADLLGSDPSDEIADPIGRSAKHYERTADEIESLVRTAVDLLFPPSAQE